MKKIKNRKIIMILGILSLLLCAGCGEGSSITETGSISTAQTDIASNTFGEKTFDSGVFE